MSQLLKQGGFDDLNPVPVWGIRQSRARIVLSMARSPGSVGDNALLTRENTDPRWVGQIRFGCVKRVNYRTDNALFREPFGQCPIFFCELTGGLSRGFNVQKLSFVEVGLLHLVGCDQLGLLDRFQFDLEKSVCHEPVAALSTVFVMAQNTD